MFYTSICWLESFVYVVFKLLFLIDAIKFRFETIAKSPQPIAFPVKVFYANRFCRNYVLLVKLHLLKYILPSVDY